MNRSSHTQALRTFFSLAAIFSVASASAWALIYFNLISLNTHAISSSQWHAHEMIYGYSAAVIAGFLLTAMREWTGFNTTTTMRLCLLALCWVLARAFCFTGHLAAAALFDLTFLLALNILITLPILQSKLYKHMAIASKTALLFIFNLCFYLNALGYINSGITLGIYGGFYLIIGLILMMGRRLIPTFIENAAKSSLTIQNSNGLDRASLLFFFIFFFSELIQPHSIITAYSALALFFINAIRLKLWHTAVIWKNPLLWVLYCSLWFITSGFLLFFLSYFGWVSKFLAIHAMAYGGLGLMTLGMMVRITLEYSGQDINQPSAAINIAFIALVAGALSRTLLPIIFPAAYLSWVAFAMALWALAFVIFLWVYGSYLSRYKFSKNSATKD